MFVCFCVYKSKTYSFIRFIGIKVFEYLFIQIYVMENCNSYCEIFYTQSLIRFDIYFTLSSLSLCFFLLWERESFIAAPHCFHYSFNSDCTEYRYCNRSAYGLVRPDNEYLNSETFEHVKVYLFVATLPYSQYLYVEACGECIYRIFCRSENKGTAYYGGNEND